MTPKILSSLGLKFAVLMINVTARAIILSHDNIACIINTACAYKAANIYTKVEPAKNFSTYIRYQISVPKAARILNSCRVEINHSFKIKYVRKFHC